ncbi:MAG TPA: MFS transporter [Trebonia sp.]|nr:MFS transporter [Trebonia sp.]
MAGLQRALLGDRIHPGLGWVLTTVGANFAAFTALMVYAGPWLVQTQHASLGLVSTTLTVGGLLGMVVALIAGQAVHSADRRRLIVATATAQTAAAIILVLPVSRLLTIVALIAAAGVQPLRGVAQRTLIADAGAGEKGFADFRLAIYVGSFAGPAVAGVLAGVGWPELRIGVAGMYAVSLASALRLPRGHDRVPEGPSAPVADILRDRRLWLLLACSGAAWTVMYMFETVLPTLAVGPNGISIRNWGILYSLGPLYVLVAQLRFQRWLRSAPVWLRLSGGLLMMGVPFLLFTWRLSVPTVIVFLPVFLTGDMIWGPASDDLVARAAPPQRTGVYFGVATATMWAGSALAPAVGLPIAQSFGNSALWLATMLLALLSAGIYIRAAMWVRPAGTRTITSATDIQAASLPDQ